MKVNGPGSCISQIKGSHSLERQVDGAAILAAYPFDSVAPFLGHGWRGDSNFRRVEGALGK